MDGDGLHDTILTAGAVKRFRRQNMALGHYSLSSYLVVMALNQLLGTHVSVAGGAHTAFARASQIGCTTMQIFVKNASQWKAKPLSAEDIESYKSAGSGATVSPVIAHAAYLINLCAQQPDTSRRSREAFEEELNRCEALGIMGLVVHPGAHLGAGEEAGIRQIAESLNEIHLRTPGFRTLTLLETTAGQGTTLGSSFDQLRHIIDGIHELERVAVCLDTCHVFAAGHDIRSPQGWEAMLDEFESKLGVRLLKAIHVNDSKKDLGSRVDRHEHIGMGRIGLEGFRFLMNDERLAGIPKILETEKSEDMHEDVENMNRLLSLVGSAKS
jgi:deoxyribonuclease IV